MLHGADKGFVEAVNMESRGNISSAFLKKENPWLDQGFS